VIRKAVFPVAGLGTRMLPATKALPKEMLPVVDRPLIQYAFEEARAAGIEQIIFVTGRGKSILEDHFDRAYELEEVLARKRKTAELEAVSGWVPAAGELSYTRQPEALGLGHAVWCARHLVGDEPFAVVLVDDLILSEEPCLQQMVEAFAETRGNLVAVEEVAQDQTNRYGVLDPLSDDGRLVEIRGLVEKPDPADRCHGPNDRPRAVPRPAFCRAQVRLRRQARLSGGDGRLRARTRRSARRRARDAPTLSLTYARCSGAIVDMSSVAPARPPALTMEVPCALR
jgi:NDP-sugar pyrophosphorylase family protein